ncbi:MAG TPA: DUF2867 domain-containing protein [Actinophytocola sp.]|jgi:hypothetical protein|nr:DUF2867 domain-containing protein [Actinophytocola sp.]
MSGAYQLMPNPNWAATTTIAVHDGNARDAAGWARAVFNERSTPAWVKALFVGRMAIAFVLRLPQGTPDMLAVRDVRDGEAIIDTDDKHLRFVAGVRADDHLLHVTTAVTFKGWRGRLYFIPVRFLHDQVTRSMMHSAARRDEPS